MKYSYWIYESCCTWVCWYSDMAVWFWQTGR